MEIKTLKEVSQELGYSMGTVSRAINNKKGVSETTRKEILAALDNIGYRPNRLAQGLVKKQSHFIGVIVPDFSNDFLGYIVHTIEEELEAMDYHMLLFSTDWNSEIEKQKIQLALSNQVDGIIIKPVSTKSINFDNLPVPVVLASQTYTDKYSWIDIDNVHGGNLATEHLLKCGYKKICFVGLPSSDLIYKDRLKGYTNALEAYNIPVSEDYIFYCDPNIQAGYELMNELLKLPEMPDAAFCCDDAIALGLMSCASDHGISIPDDFGLVGFNDTDISKLPQINLTTIYQPKSNIGRFSVQMLLNMIDSKEPLLPQKMILSPSLQIRSTTRKISE